MGAGPGLCRKESWAGGRAQGWYTCGARSCVMGQGALSRAGGRGRCTHRTQGCSIPKVLAKDPV